MKKLFLALGIILLAFANFSCKKDNVNNGIVGTWKYMSSIGGFVNIGPQHSNSQMKLTETNYEFVKDGQIVESGTYKITDEKSWNGDPRIIFEGRTSEIPKQYIKVSKNKLTIFVSASIAADGVESYYTRIRN